MLVSIWILGVSAVCVVGMFLYRQYELASGRQLFSEERRLKSDDIVRKYSEKLIVFLKKIGLQLKECAKLVFDRLHVLLHRIWVYISGRVDQYFDRLRGHRWGGKNGNISLYWQGRKNDKE